MITENKPASPPEQALDRTMPDNNANQNDIEEDEVRGEESSDGSPQEEEEQRLTSNKSSKSQSSSSGLSNGYSLHQTAARDIGIAKSAAKRMAQLDHRYSSQELSFEADWQEHGLLATITGALPEEIERFWDAMIEELKGITDLEVYDEVDVPKGTHIIGTKWVLKEKKATSLLPAKLKARLVARGFTQKYGINYEETYAPVSRTATTRCVYAVCAFKSWKIKQSDVEKAFLNGEMDMPNVFVRQPPFCEDPAHPNRV